MAAGKGEEETLDLYYDIAGNQINGARDYQEDAFLTTFLDDAEGRPKSAALVIMADGMGGHAAGNIASNLVVSTFNSAFTAGFGAEDVSTVLRESLIKANGALSESIRETPALDGMGCTMVGSAFTKGKVWWTSVGDSHLYLIRDRELIKKNEDHSYGGYLDRMAAQGMDVDAEPGLSRNMLMSAMTGEDIQEIDCPNKPLQLLPGDRLVVASDGLDTLSEGTLIQMSTWSRTAKECVDAMLKAVEDAGKPRQDNATVIVIDVLDRDAEQTLVEEAPPSDEPDHGSTQPLDLDKIEAAISVDEGAGEVRDDAGEGEGGGKMGLVIAVAAVALLVLAGAAYFFIAGSGEPPAPAVAIPAPAAPAAQPSPAAPVASPPTATQPPAARPAPVPPPAPAVAKEFRDKLESGGEGPLMVRIPGGSFLMGSSGLSPNADERPQHEVTIKPFAGGKYEVTFAEYERFAKATGRERPDNLYLEKETHPVIFVSWDDALAYTQWLSQETGEKYRLPSESEWEYLASGRADTPYWWGFDFKPKMGHCFDCETGLDPRKPTRVGRFDPNPFGVHDTAGNVTEWVYDCYHKNYQGAPTDGSVWEGGDCTVRVVRGGSYSSPSTSLKTAKRSKLKSTNVYDSVGFRVVRGL